MWQAAKPAQRCGIALCAVLIMAQLLSACESLPATNTGAFVNATVAPNFSLTGRLSVRNGERLDSVKLVWQKSADEERLKFFTPFGSQLAEVWQLAGAKAILQQGRDLVAAESLGVLTESVLGISLDTAEIGHWIQGVGLEDGVPREMQMRDGSTWQVTAERMQIAPAPDKSGSVNRYAARLTAVNGATTIRLVVDEWRAL